jgi:hypothetical protein
MPQFAERESRLAWEPRSFPSRTRSLYIFAVPASVFQPTRQQLDRHPFKPRCPPPVAIPLQFRTYFPTMSFSGSILCTSFPIPSSYEHLAPCLSLFDRSSTRSTLTESPNANYIPPLITKLFFSTSYARC